MGKNDQHAASQLKSKMPFYKTTWFTVVMTIVFFPVGLILAWVNKDTVSKVARIAITVIVALAVVGMVLVFSQQKEIKAIGRSSSVSIDSDEQNLIHDNGSPNNDAISEKITDGIKYGNETVRWNGTIDSVIGNNDASGKYWIVVNAYAESYATADSLLTDNVQSASALAQELSQYPSIQKVVWNGYAKTDSGSKAVAMQVIYSTADVPAELNNDTSIMIQRAETYNIKDVLYRSLKNYASVPQEKSGATMSGTSDD